MVGSYAVGAIADRFYQGRLKRLVLLMLGGGLVTFLWFGLSVDSFQAGFRPLPSSLTSQAIAIALAGFFIGGTAGLFMELGAECIHPIPAGFASNAIALAINVTNCLSLGIFPYINELLVNPIVFFVVVLCTIVVLFVREDYNRSAAKHS